MDGSALDPALDASAELEARFLAMKSAWAPGTAPDLAERRHRLRALKAAIQDAHDDIIDTINADFGHRAVAETRAAEIAMTIATIDYLDKHLSGWMKPKRRTHLTGAVPGQSEVWLEPKGVVGIIAPWNYPFQLAIVPLATALAAGNAVMLKPSEITPKTSALLASLLGKTFDDKTVQVVEGGPNVAAAFTALPFAHLFYTGSTAVGRKVAAAAAPNLTPVTLELGGKSPCVVMPGADPQKHAPLIANGKFFSAGQTCVAPDYLLVPEGQERSVAAAVLDCVREFYGETLERDYSSIVSDRHFDRLQAMVDEAREKGATVLTVGEADKTSRRFPPTIVIDPPADGALMQEEIFGPVLPILSYTSLDAAAAHINAGDHPLSAYTFGDDVPAAKAFLRQILSGGAAVNASILHLAIEELPFGGVGASGYGAYHGERGFREFSHERSVLVFPRWGWLQRTITPPHGKVFEMMMKRLIGR